jgi:hypothetical protein
MTFVDIFLTLSILLHVQCQYMIDMFSCVCSFGGLSIKCCISYFILSVEEVILHICDQLVANGWL